MADYVLEGPKWGTIGLGTSGGTVTWAYDGTVPASFSAVLTAAFADWASYANIRFQQVASTAAAQIDFSVGAIDGLSNILAQTSYYGFGTTFTSAAIEFDSGENWSPTGGAVVSGTGINLFVVALHEIGHAIGLGHYNVTPAVMNAVVDRSVTNLTQSDIDGILAIYGTTRAATILSDAGPAPDLNADSKSDILWRSVNGDVVFWDNLVGGSHAGDSLGNVGTNWLISGAADFSGDGKSDLLWRSTGGDVVIWDQIANNGSHGGQSLGNVGLGWNIVAAGDFDGDGKTDILWRSNTGDLVDWTNIANGTHGGQSLGNASLDLHVAGVADFNGDGKADILWRNANGDVSTWENIVGTSHTTESFGNVGTGWDITNLGDYNGDGKADILWHSSGGDVVAWENLANNSHGGESFGNVGLSWTVQQHKTDII